ncbi:ATP-dependent DNA helicase tlh2 [Mizuhopecten yessoensis]|uniref:DNA 3'-5' helicase n=1 Tax=Mizuhopecten yessoensis TaxID=6573 RepID=A0A210QG28_MIZYE|nr:ATP-dependent DNA helicase tlh2 [Mizuhopecten yessoensis]
MAMAWLVDALSESNFPRTILYCHSIKDASNIYSYLKTELPECDMLDMFHSETPEEKKTNSIKELQTADSQLKMVTATSALGMGIDVVDTHSVILYCVPKHLTDIIQEIGRVGRDCKSSVAMLLYNSYHLNKVDPDVKEMYKTQNPYDYEATEPHVPDDDEATEPYYHDV